LAEEIERQIQLAEKKFSVFLADKNLAADTDIGASLGSMCH